MGLGGLISPVSQYVQGVIAGWLRQIIVNDGIPGLLIVQTGAGVGLRVETGIEVQGIYVGGDLATSTATGTYAFAHGDNCDATGNYSGVASGSANIASSNYSFVGGGQNNEAKTNTHATVGGGSGNDATGQYSTVGGGQSNLASGSAAIVGGGEANVASGSTSAVGGGSTNRASGSRSFVPGGRQGLADKYGQMAHGAGQFAAQGDAQRQVFVARSVETHDDNTWRELFLDGTTSRMTIPTDTVWTFQGEVVGMTQGCAQSFGYLVNGVVENDGGTTTLQASTITTLHEDVATYDCRMVGDNANDALVVELQDTAAGGLTVRWVATLYMAQVRFPA